MFNANLVAQGLTEVDSCDKLVELLADSVDYTFGDRFYNGNYKLGTANTQPDESHPDWVWSPITGNMFAIARCQLIAGKDIIIMTTGSRSGNRSKQVLCIYCTSASVRGSLVDVLNTAEGGTTIGAKLAALLGYTDWASVAGPSSAQANKYTFALVTASGVETGVASWISPISLNLPDDGGHEYVSTYDEYSGLMLMDETVGMPTMLTWGWNPVTTTGDLTMCKSSYDADSQNTMDIVHHALAARTAAAINRIAANEQHITGLIAANGTLYSVISMIPVFGATFVDIVDAQHRIEQASQYIPRP